MAWDFSLDSWDTCCSPLRWMQGMWTGAPRCATPVQPVVWSVWGCCWSAVQRPTLPSPPARPHPSMRPAWEVSSSALTLLFIPISLWHNIFLRFVCQEMQTVWSSWSPRMPVWRHMTFTTGPRCTWLVQTIIWSVWKCCSMQVSVTGWGNIPKNQDF